MSADMNRNLPTDILMRKPNCIPVCELFNPAQKCLNMYYLQNLKEGLGIRALAVTFQGYELVLMPRVSLIHDVSGFFYMKS